MLLSRYVVPDLLQQETGDLQGWSAPQDGWETSSSLGTTTGLGSHVP